MRRGLMDLIAGALKPEPKVVDANLFENELAHLLSNGENAADSLKELFEISNLRLNPNDLTRLDVALGTKYLKCLRLVDTHILPSLLDRFSNGLRLNRFLQVLDLSQNPLGDSGVATLVGAIKFKPSLTELYLCDVKFTKDGCVSLGELLKQNKSLTVLDFSDNLLGDEGVEILCDGLLNNSLGEKTILMKFCLQNCEISDRGCAKLHFVCREVRTLVELNLSKNSIHSEGVKSLANGLKQNYLLNDPVVAVPVGQEQPTNSALEQLEPELHGVKILNLSSNPLGSKGVSDFAKYLGAIGTIKSLYLKDVKMDNTALEKLAKEVVEVCSVEELDVSQNPLSTKEADSKTDSSAYFSVIMPIISLMQQNIDMNLLDLSHVSLSLNDIKQLGDFLGQNVHCRVKALRLSNCNIDDDGAVALATGLKFNMGLKKLDVTANVFGPKGARVFSKMFTRAKQLEEFRVTGQSRIGSEGENYLAECLKYNKKLVIKGATKELEYLDSFVHKGGAFVKNEKGELAGWSNEAWQVVKRGCGQVIGTVLYNLDKKEFQEFKRNVLLKSKNVVNQNMFEYVIRHADTPATEVVLMFLNKCKLNWDDDCSSKASAAIIKEKRGVDDGTYREIAKEFAKDPVIKEMAKNKSLFLGRYLVEYSASGYRTHEVTRIVAKDTANGKEPCFVMMYENELDFAREKESREELLRLLRAAGPFAVYDTILKEKEFHDESNAISFKPNITDLRNSIANLGVTAGFDINETVFLALKAAECLGTVNNLGRIHGDFRPRNFLKVANERWGDDALGRSSTKVKLSPKWVLFDLSKSVPHNHMVSVRMDSSYMPPEVARVSFNMNYHDKALPLASEKLDVWAFGVVLFQLLTGAHLFHVESNTDRIYKKKERLELMNWINLDKVRQNLVLHRANEALFLNKTTFLKIHESAIDLLNWCLQGDPLNRPNFSQILSHPFFKYKTLKLYTNVDLLLGWYQSIGANKSLAEHKNNRTHAHCVNTTSSQTADVFKTLKYYYTQAGCEITNDEYDWKYNIDVRQESVQKSRCLIVLLEKGCFWNQKILQKLLWAVDSVETTCLTLLDISTANTSAEKFVLEEYLEELKDDKKLDEVVEFLLPLDEKLGLKHISDGNLEKEIEKDGGKKWLKNYIRNDVKDLLINLQDRIIPYRARNFQTQAMVNEILLRSGFFPENILKPFSLQDNNKEMAAANEKDNKVKRINVLILYNETDGNNKKLLTDAQYLRNKLFNLETSEYRSKVTLVGNQNEVYRYFSKKETSTNSTSSKLIAKNLTLVLCLVTNGFYDNFREALLLLNKAEGPITIVPLSYGEYNVRDKASQGEILNLGLDSSAVVNKLKDARNYIPLPSMTKNLEYETVASLNFIVKEAAKNVDVIKENETKDGNSIYTKYEDSNFFNMAVY